MRVFIVSRGIPTPEYPMNGIFEYDQAKALSSIKHEVYFISIDIRSVRRKRRFGFRVFKQNEVTVLSLSFPVGRVPLALRIYIMRKFVNKVYKYAVSRFGLPDILHVHFPQIALSLKDVIKKAEFPVVMTEHSSGMIENPIPKHLYSTASNAYKLIENIIAVSDHLSNILHNVFKVNSYVIPNIVDTSIFKYSFRPNVERFTFISVGSLIARKRMDLTVEAFANCFAGNPKYQLVIIGEGPERNKIEDMISRYNIKEQVTITGRLSRDKISSYMEMSECFVLASQAETFGVVYIEALASGLPVIATKCKGPEGFIDHANGVLIDKDDIDQLKEAMLSMTVNINAYDRNAIALKAKDDFSPELIAYQLTEYYQGLIKKNNDEIQETQI
jgi:L-malate glycosyltransferase